MATGAPTRMSTDTAPMTITRIDPALTLAQWLSPAYPLGAFAYSHGLETLVARGLVQDADTLRGWLADLLEHGSGRSDAILIRAGHAAPDPASLDRLDATARAIQPSAERLAETRALGVAFVRTTRAIWPGTLPELTFPVALGWAARNAGLPVDLTVAMALQSFASGLVSAAVRLVPLGQTDGQAVLAALSPLCQRIAEDTRGLTPDDLGTAALAWDIASMQHETLQPRLFQS